MPDTDDPAMLTRGRAAVVTSSLVAMLGAVPAFLLGALAVLIRDELHFSEGRLGMAVASFFVAGALGSVASGRWSQRLGPRRSVLVASAASALCLLGTATAGSWGLLVVWMMLGGLTNAFAQVTGNLVLAGSVRRRRQGLAFGIKQSALPAATLVSGAGVPLIGVTLGWRWAFASVALVALGVGIGNLRRQPDASRAVPARRGASAVGIDRRPLVMLGLAATFMASATMSMGTFMVEFGVSIGLEAGVAGAILATGSVVGIAFRVALGALADGRLHGDLTVVAAGLALGAFALAGMPLATDAAGLTVASMLAFTLGWGWPGMFNLAVVRRYQQVPAIATSITQVGVYVGSMLGPLTFGLVVEHGSYTTAWRLTGGALAVAAALMLAGRAASRRAGH